MAVGPQGSVSRQVHWGDPSMGAEAMRMDGDPEEGAEPGGNTEAPIRRA